MRKTKGRILVACVTLSLGLAARISAETQGSLPLAFGDASRMIAAAASERAKIQRPTIDSKALLNCSTKVKIVDWQLLDHPYQVSMGGASYHHTSTVFVKFSAVDKNASAIYMDATAHDKAGITVFMQRAYREGLELTLLFKASSQAGCEFFPLMLIGEIDGARIGSLTISGEGKVITGR